MRVILPVALLLLAAAAAAAAFFVPLRQDIEGRPAPRLDAAGQPVTSQPLSALTEADKAQAEALRKKVDDLDAKLDKHQEALSAGWNELLSEVTRENARRQVEGQRLAGVVDAAGGKPVEGQVEELMDDVAKKRVKGFLKGWVDTEVSALKNHLGLVGTQANAVDLAVADIMKEASDKIDAGEPSDNMIGWRGDVMQEARTKLQERLGLVLTGEQKLKADEWFKSNDWGRAWREQQKKSEDQRGK